MARISTFARDVQLLVDKALSPQARQKLAAESARKILAGAQEQNRQALGTSPPHKTFVDTRAEAPLESVNPDHGRIVFEFELHNEMLRWIGEQLVLHSPVLTGQYAHSHVLLADGVEVDADGKIPPATEYVFASTVPYARKIERGLSDQAEDGVYEVVADLARRRFGNLASIRFTYRSLLIPAGSSRADRQAERDSRAPAIVITLR